MMSSRVRNAQANRIGDCDHDAYTIMARSVITYVVPSTNVHAWLRRWYVYIATFDSVEKIIIASTSLIVCPSGRQCLLHPCRCRRLQHGEYVRKIWATFCVVSSSETVGCVCTYMVSLEEPLDNVHLPYLVEQAFFSNVRIIVSHTYIPPPTVWGVVTRTQPVVSLLETVKCPVERSPLHLDAYPPHCM